MCLSTVYKNEKTPENEILKNVMTITCENGFVTLTDILGREAVVEGELLRADLTGGTVVLRTKAGRSLAGARRRVSAFHLYGGGGNPWRFTRL